MKIRMMLVAIAAVVVVFAGLGAHADVLCGRVSFPTDSYATACVQLP